MNKKICSKIIILTILILAVSVTSSIIYLKNRKMNYTQKETNIEKTTLIASNADFEKVYKEIYINKNETYIKNYQNIEQRANEILTEELCVYEIDEGNRLLFVSRKCKEVIENLSFMVKILDIHQQNLPDEEKPKIQETINKYVDRAIKELINVCEFQDWHPDHFLDTAEMSYSVALGYNWLNNYLSENEKLIIEKAILEKALIPSVSLEYDRQFSEKENNWNQVCNGAMIVSAMAIYNANNIDIAVKDITDYLIQKDFEERESITLKEFCKKIIDRGIEELPYAIQQIQPDGGYIEGITYWEYGNSYMVYALSSMQLTLNNTYGLLDNKYMKQTILYPIYLTGKSSTNLQDTKVFNYGDADDFVVNVAASTWLTNQYYKDKELSYIVNWYQENYQENLNIYQLLWQEEEYMTDKISQDSLDEILKNISDKTYSNSEVAILQNNILDKNGIYVATKVGKNGDSNHYDLDIGSFVLDANGTRWIEDFGKENYNVKGYWGKTSRWNYYKKRAEAHSTIVFEKDVMQKTPDQYIEADCKIIDFQSNEKESYVLLDLSNAYNADDNTEDYERNTENRNNNKVQRKITLDKVANKVILEDEITLEQSSNIYSMFNIASGTKILIDDSGTTATLNQKVKQEDGTEKEEILLAKIMTENVYWQIGSKIPMNQSLLEIEENPDFECNLDNKDENKLYVYLQNFGSGKIEIEFIPQ